jgi:hypothetical protein
LILSSLAGLQTQESFIKSNKKTVAAVSLAPKTPAEGNESLSMPEDRHGQDLLRDRCSSQAALFFPRFL